LSERAIPAGPRTGGGAPRGRPTVEARVILFAGTPAQIEVGGSSLAIVPTKVGAVP
jgi:hypothetical protein